MSDYVCPKCGLPLAPPSAESEKSMCVGCANAERFGHQWPPWNPQTIFKNEPEIMNIAQTAEYLQVSRSSLYRLAVRGKVPAAKIGGAWRFKRSVLNELFSGRGPSG